MAQVKKALMVVLAQAAVTLPFFAADDDETCSDIPAADAIDRHRVERLEVAAGEVALNLAEGRCPNLDLLPFQVFLNHGVEAGQLVLAAALGPVPLRVLTEGHPGQCLLGCCTCRLGCQHIARCRGAGGG